MMPPEMREAIETATRAGRVCMLNPATGQLIFDDRAPLDSISSIDAWLVEHPGYSSLQVLVLILVLVHSVACVARTRICCSTCY